MNPFEKIFFSYGWSWSDTKLAPFIVISILSLLFFFWLVSFFARWKYRILISLLVVFTPLLTYFSFYPIYENDFKVQYQKTNWPQELDHVPDSGVVVVTIPGCTYCEEAVSRCNVMHNRNPAITYAVIVIGFQPDDLKHYKDLVKGNIKVLFAADQHKFIEMSDGRFPLFLKRKKDKALYWNNNDVGPAVLDFLEK